jgi:hypothetical protein
MLRKHTKTQAQQNQTNRTPPTPPPPLLHTERSIDSSNEPPLPILFLSFSLSPPNHLAFRGKEEKKRNGTERNGGKGKTRRGEEEEKATRGREKKTVREGN